MGKKTAAVGECNDVALESAKSAGRARVAEARGDADVAAWAEKNADMLEQRLRNRAVS